MSLPLPLHAATIAYELPSNRVEVGQEGAYPDDGHEANGERYLKEAAIQL